MSIRALESDYVLLHNISHSEDLSVGDYNNDGMDDLYCHGDEENNSVAKSTIKGKFRLFSCWPFFSEKWWNMSKNKPVYLF